MYKHINRLQPVVSLFCVSVDIPKGTAANAHARVYLPQLSTALVLGHVDDKTCPQNLHNPIAPPPPPILILLISELASPCRLEKIPERTSHILTNDNCAKIRRQFLQSEQQCFGGYHPQNAPSLSHTHPSLVPIPIRRQLLRHSGPSLAPGLSKG